MRKSRFNVDDAAGLDVSEGAAVEVDQQTPLSALVGNEDDCNTESVVWLQIWKTARSTKKNLKNSLSKY